MFDCLQWYSREDSPLIPRLAPPPAEPTTMRSPAKPTAPPVRHVQFAISTPPSPKADEEALLSPTQQSMPQPLAGTFVAAALEDDLEDVQRVGGPGGGAHYCTLLSPSSSSPSSSSSSSSPSSSSSSTGSKGCQSAIFEEIFSSHGGNHVVSGGWPVRKGGRVAVTRCVFL